MTKPPEAEVVLTLSVVCFSLLKLGDGSVEVCAVEVHVRRDWTQLDGSSEVLERATCVL